LYEKDWVENFSMEFGIGKITVANSTHMMWEFIENKEDGGKGAVTDSAWIVKRERGVPGEGDGGGSKVGLGLASGIASGLSGVVTLLQ